MKAAVLALFLVLTAGRGAIADPAVPAGAPTVTLLDPGKGPRKELRFTAVKGMRRTLTMSMKMSVDVAMGTTQMPSQKLPVIQMTMALKVTEVAMNGDIRYELVLKKPRVVRDKATPASTIKALEASLAGLTGLSGYAVITNRGFTKEADINVPLATSPQTRQYLESLRQSMSQLAAPVPAEPVGIGATWETVTRLSQTSMTLDQTASNKLVALRGNRAKLAIALTQTAAPQKITTNGVSVDLRSYKATGSGETTLELAGVIPSAAKMAVRSAMTMDTMGTLAEVKLGLVMTMKGK